MDPMLKNLIRVGKVSSVNPDNCTVRVAFEDQANVVSYDLPVIVRGSLETKDYWLPVPNEQVVCLFLPSGNAQGFVLGSIYSLTDTPPVTDGNKRHVAFPDGTTVEYDCSASKLTIDAKGEVEITAAKIIKVDAAESVEVTTTGEAKVIADTASITAPKGVTISASDASGTGVSIVGKSSSQSW